jgi:hypothetical protein
MIIEALERKRPVDGQHTLHPVELVRRDSTTRMA